MIFLVNFTLKVSKADILRILEQQNVRVGYLTDHATVCQVFGDHDPIDVLAARVVFPWYQLNLNEIVDIHGVVE